MALPSWCIKLNTTNTLSWGVEGDCSPCVAGSSELEAECNFPFCEAATVWLVRSTLQINSASSVLCPGHHPDSQKTMSWIFWSKLFKFKELLGIVWDLCFWLTLMKAAWLNALIVCQLDFSLVWGIWCYISKHNVCNEVCCKYTHMFIIYSHIWYYVNTFISPFFGPCGLILMIIPLPLLLSIDISAVFWEVGTPLGTLTWR